MKRAAVLIGVAKTGGLQPLRAVSSCLKSVSDWANEQQFDSVVSISDETGDVTASDIKKAVAAAVDGNFDQLVIYFAGHGVNLHRGEYWLLSGAPRDTQEAVNVEGSVVLARQSGIPHVVMISDACRTAADGLRAQNVTGSDVFPNDDADGTEKCVDLFFASTLGKPALEVRDPNEAIKAYRAVYTDALVSALRGASEPPLERSRGKGFVRPRPLKRYLGSEVTRRLRALGVSPTISQTPDARITSDEDAFLSEIPLPYTPPPAAAVAARSGRSGGFLSMISRSLWKFVRQPPSIVTFSRDRVAEESYSPPLSAADAASIMLRNSLRGPFGNELPYDVQGRALLLDGIDRVSEQFGPERFESHCGIKSNGKAIAHAFAPDAVNIERRDSHVFRLNSPVAPATNVLLEFEDGSGTVIPAIPEFLTTLTFDNDGELADISWEPSANSWRWEEFSRRADTIRRLRAIIAASARLGIFRLEGEDSGNLAREIQYSKTVDPGMAIYAAYAYHDQQQRERLDQMQQYQVDDLGMTFYDLALLNRQLGRMRLMPHRISTVPFFPMLSQGWALLRAFNVHVPDSFAEIQHHLLPSLWTTFDSEGVKLLRETINRLGLFVQ